MKASARETALGVLQACRRDGAWADGALKTAISRDKLFPQDAALATHIVYGVLQNRLLIDYVLGAYCSQRPDKLEPVLLDILRVGAYQILFLDRIPDSAAVNEAVEQAKGHNKARAGGLINAVLRKVSQNKNALPLPKRAADTTRWLSVRYSHPKWLVERLLALVGEAETEAFLKDDNAAAPLTVQVNTLRTDAQALTASLEAAGVTVQPHPWLEDCLTLSATGDLTALDAFRQGWFWVQDPAAKLVSLAADIRPGDTVIDVCAAPGGKSFGAAMALAGRGRIVSCDVHPHKLKLMEAGAERLGIACLEPLLADGREPQEALVDAAEAVIVDAPCSGLGIIRKKPDIRYKDSWTLSALPTIQRAILDNAARYVKPGGTLVYSTCTILPEENEAVTDAFLAAHPAFVQEAFALPGTMGETEGRVTLWPQRHGTDGFYICRMRRKTT